MSKQSVGVVVIGRNEGERLRACLESVRQVDAVVYVDSGSTDGSMALARSLGAAVIPLDLAIPFTAARARNAGIQWLVEQQPNLAFVQTIDGDCALDPAWLAAAVEDLLADPTRAVVFGRRRERFPACNAYHRACDDEWDVATGRVDSCGGDALFRLAALREVGGFNSSLIAGEEPELCLRLRRRGWKIWSNGREMTLHDVAITRFRQWWHRSRRTGYAMAELVSMHGAAANPAWQSLLRSALAWTAVMALVPIGGLAALLHHESVVLVAALMPLALCTAQLMRLASKRRQFGFGGGLRWAGLIMAAKPAQTYGWLQYQLQRRAGTRATLIEYKT